MKKSYIVMELPFVQGIEAPLRPEKKEGIPKMIFLYFKKWCISSHLHMEMFMRMPKEAKDNAEMSVWG